MAFGPRLWSMSARVDKKLGGNAARFPDTLAGYSALMISNLF